MLTVKLTGKEKNEDKKPDDKEDWFKTGEDVDDFIFYQQTDKVSEK